ncbi:unnamed protein product [Boreogadus saida]
MTLPQHNVRPPARLHTRGDQEGAGTRPVVIRVEYLSVTLNLWTLCNHRKRISNLSSKVEPNPSPPHPHNHICRTIGPVPPEVIGLRPQKQHGYFDGEDDVASTSAICTSVEGVVFLNSTCRRMDLSGPISSVPEDSCHRLSR